MLITPSFQCLSNSYALLLGHSTANLYPCPMLRCPPVEGTVSAGSVGHVFNCPDTTVVRLDHEPFEIITETIVTESGSNPSHSSGLLVLIYTFLSWTAFGSPKG